MIEFSSTFKFSLPNQEYYTTNILKLIASEGFSLGDLQYIFCDDNYLLQLNIKYLNHDTLTDIITFNYNIGKQINGEVYISIERVKENAQTFQVSFENELTRVMGHGVLHLCGYKDKTKSQQLEMRNKENEFLQLFSLKP